MDFESKYDRRNDSQLPALEALAPALRPFIRDRSITSIEPLSGGYSNQSFKFSIEGMSTPFVLRVSQRSRNDVEAELSVLKLVGSDVPAPAVLHIDLDNPQIGQHLVVLEYIEGEPLCRVDAGWSRKEIERFAARLGETMAAIHRKRLASPGLLGPNLSISVPLEPFDRATVDHMLKSLEIAENRKRVSTEEGKRIREFIASHASLLSGITPDRALVHSDFNQKNILVSPGNRSLAGIIDWEFAFSGAPIMDFANFFRFEEEMPPGYEPSLTRSYRAAGGTLPDDWKPQARYIDLINMLMFLSGTELRPRTFNTALGIIRRTMAEFQSNFTSASR